MEVQLDVAPVWNLLDYITVDVTVHNKSGGVQNIALQTSYPTPIQLIIKNTIPPYEKIQFVDIAIPEDPTYIQLEDGASHKYVIPVNRWYFDALHTVSIPQYNLYTTGEFTITAVYCDIYYPQNTYSSVEKVVKIVV